MTDLVDATRGATASECPYVGLRNFTEREAEFFFGREEDRKRIIGNLRVARLTLLYAESGVGKSSVLRAGVMRRLRELADSSRADGAASLDVPVIFSSWSSDPTQALIDQIADATRPFIADPAELPRDSLEEAIVTATDAADADLLIILDQFEEYFSNQSREGHDATFPEQLAHCINRADLRANFLISIREDAYARIGDLLKSRVANVYSNFLHLEYLDESAARDTILKPIERWNELHEHDTPYEVESSLADAVVRQVRLGEVTTSDHQASDGQVADDGAARVETTYLQLVMKRLWDEEIRVGSHRLRLETLQSLGGAQNIIGTHLDTAMAQLTADQQDAAAAAFRFLVTTTGMKIAISARDLADMSGRPESELDSTLRRLAAADLHILRPVVVPEDPERPRFEIFHDALAQPIRDWRGRYVRSKAEEQQLVELEHQRTQLAAAKAEVRRERRRRVALSAVSLVLVGLLVAVLALWRRSEDLSRRSESAKLASQALSEGANPERSLDLAKQAVDKATTPEALLAVRSALAKPYVDEILPERIGKPDSTVVDRSPTGGLIAVGGENGAWLWDPQKHTIRKLKGVTSAQAMHFSADGSRVLVVDYYTALLFDTHGREVGKEPKPPDDSYFLDGAISPDGERVVTLLSGNHPIVVQSADGVAVSPPLNDSSGVNAAEFSADGTLVTVTENETLTVWNADGTKRASLDHVLVSKLSRDGTTLATGGWEHTVRLWRLSDMTLVASLPTQDGVLQLAFDAKRPDIFTAVGQHGTLWVFDLLHPELEPRVVRTGFNLDEIAVSAPPLLMASGSGSVAIWDAHLGVALEKFDLSGRIFDLRLADDGTYSFVQVSWVKGTGDGAKSVATMRLWRGQTGTPTQALQANVVQTSFSQDHRHLRIVYEDASGFDVEVRSYPALGSATHMRPSPPEGSEASDSVELWIASDAGAAKFSTVIQHYGTPDTMRIQLWDPATGNMVRELSSAHPNGVIEAFEMTPDGRSVLISGFDPQKKKNPGYVEQIPTDGGRPVRLVEYAGSPSAIAWDRDGRFFVLGDDRGRSYIFPTSGGSPKVLGTKKDRGTARVTAVVLSADSRFIATGTEEGWVDLWDRRSGRHLRHFELGSAISALDFGRGNRYLLADGENTPTTVLSTAGDQDRNAVMLVDPIPESLAQSAAFDLATRGRPSVVSTDGQYVMRYPCVACVSEKALLREVERRLASSKLRG